MTEVRRPAPPQPPRERWRYSLERLRLSAGRFSWVDRSQGEAMAGESGGQLAPGLGKRSRIGTGVSGLLMSLGAVLLVIAGVIAFGSWRGRSSVPLDDQLPYLLGVEPAAASEATNEASGASQELDVEPAIAGAVESAPAADAIDEPDRARADGDGGARANDGAQAAPASVVVVHVSGAVANAGVVELVDGTRVHHAVAAAGGATALADLERVNLAALLVDGERIHVPAVGESDVPDVVAPSRSAEPFGDGAARGSDAEEPVAVDVNRASVGELERLPGIGPSIARAILDLRTVRGAYASVDELLLVDGIGPAKLEALRPHAYVTPGG